MLAFALPALAAFTPYEQLKAARVQHPRTSALVSPLDGLAAGRSLVVVPPCADTYVPEPPCCTYGLRVPASWVSYVPEAQGSSSARGSHYCTAYVKPRACRTYRVPCGASQVLPQLGEFDSAEMCEQLVAVADDLQAAGVALRVVGIGDQAAGQRFSDFTGLPLEALHSSSSRPSRRSASTLACTALTLV